MPLPKNKWHYLRRMFVNDKNIYVFNDLRYKDDTNDSAQIDHLILHRHGFIIIESKSVSSGVAVNKQGEWVRFWDGKPHGMPSPIQQAKFQIEFLRRALEESAESLVGKMLGFIQTRFNNCPFEILVAISNKGSIKREIDLPEVVKADQVPDKIKEIYERHKKAASLLDFSIKKFQWDNMDGIYNFSNEEISKISAFLKKYHHTGLTDSPAVPQPQRVEESDPDWKYKPKPEPKPKTVSPAPSIHETDMGICDKCGEQCIIKWGKFSYYWKCHKCDNNMAIKEYCPSCKKKLMLRKKKNEYSIYCATCVGERPYYKFISE